MTASIESVQKLNGVGFVDSLFAGVVRQKPNVLFRLITVLAEREGDNAIHRLTVAHDADAPALVFKF